VPTGKWKYVESVYKSWKWEGNKLHCSVRLLTHNLATDLCLIRITALYGKYWQLKCWTKSDKWRHFVNNAAGNSVHVWKGSLHYLMECPVYSCSGTRPLTIQREALYWWKHTCQGPVLINASYQTHIVFYAWKCVLWSTGIQETSLYVCHICIITISFCSFTLLFSNI